MLERTSESKTDDDMSHGRIVSRFEFVIRWLLHPASMHASLSRNERVSRPTATRQSATDVRNWTAGTIPR